MRLSDLSRSRRWRRSITAIALVSIAVVALAVGYIFGQRSMVEPLQSAVASAQAIIYFNDIIGNGALKNTLEAGCYDLAIRKLDVKVDQDMATLAELAKRGRLIRDAELYMDERSPGFVAALGSFHSKYGDHWNVRKCP